MPVASNQGVDLYYEASGGAGGRAATDGEARLPVVFVGEAGLGAWQWSVQQPAIAGPRRTVVWDLRGTGRSDAPPGPYGVDDLAADLEAVLTAAGVNAAHVVGAGLGGMVALRYGREYDRARSLALFGTARAGEAVDETALRALLPAERDPETVRGSLAGAFSDEFRTENSEFVDRVVDWRLAADADADSDAVDAQIAAMGAFEAGPLYEMTVPALVGHGEADPVVPPAAGRALAEDLPRGEYVPIAGRHLAHVESGSAVNDRLVSFFESVESEE